MGTDHDCSKHSPPIPLTPSALNGAPFTRRSVLRALAGTAALGAMGTMGAVSRQAKAAQGDRKFLFFFAGGGWDATPLDPKFGSDGLSPVGGTDMDPDTYLGTAGNLSWSAGDDRRGMDRFFRRWGGSACIVRGVNVHSAGHEAGMQWMMTGTSTSSRPDWPTILSANGSVEYPMPHLVFSGPAYPGSLGAAVVRGGGGTLLQLIDGSINGEVDRPAPVVATPMDEMMDSVVFDRAARYAAGRKGLGRTRADDLLTNLEKGMELEGRRFEAGLSDNGSSMLDQAMMAVEVMRLGLTRCAMIGVPGGWDTHGGNQNVGEQLDSFYQDLEQIMSHLATTPGSSAPWLIDEVTIVCCSELGRTPKFNGSQGRDHWPYTSMLLLGSGIRGNQVVGGTDEGFIALNADFQTGEVSDSGETIGTEHVGTALLKLGEVDPEKWLPGVPQLDAILRDSG
jgi:hypothetical protein